MSPVHDYVIDNSTGANVRSDINNVLQAILTNNSSSSAPSTTAAYMWWADTTNGVLKIRNSSNNDWVELLQLDGTLTLEDGSASTPALAFRDDLNTGIFSSAADTFNVATAGVERMELGATTIFNEDGADVDFRIEGDTEANLFYVDAGNDRIGIGTPTPNTSLEISTATADLNLQRTGTHSTSDGPLLQFKGRGPNAVMYNFAKIDGVSTGSNNQGHLRFFTNLSGSQTEKMRLDKDGRLLLGSTTADDAAQMLKVARTSGTARLAIQAANDGSSQLDFADVADADVGRIQYDHSSNFMALFTDNSERMRIDSDGNMMIGTTTKGANGADELTIATSGDTGISIRSGTSSQGAIYFADGTSGSDNFRGILRYFHNTNAMVFNTDSSERMRIDSSGKLLVGLTSGLSSQDGSIQAAGPIIAKSFINSHTSNAAVLQYSSNEATLRAYGATSGSGILAFRAGGGGDSTDTEHMRIDSSGKLMVGGTTADAKFAVIDSSNPDIAMRYNGTSGGHETRLLFMDKRGVINAQVANVLINDNVGEATAHLKLSTANNGTLSARMILDNDGRVNINTSSGISAGLVNIKYDRNTFHALNIQRTNSGTGNNLSFLNSSASFVGSISSDDSSTAYNTSSDYRLKENAVAISDGITRIKTLKPYKFNWIADETNTLVDGFFAHEVSDAVPEAVTGTKDQVATDSDLGYTKGDPIYQQIDQSKLVPLLVAAVKELITKVETLEAA